MIRAIAERGWLDGERAMMESPPLLQTGRGSQRRGAGPIWAVEAAKAFERLV